MRWSFTLFCLFATALGAAPAQPTLQLINGTGQPTGESLRLNDVRCSFQDGTWKIRASGEKSVQFATSLIGLSLYPTTRIWEGTTDGARHATVLQDAEGGRWTGGARTTCDFQLAQDGAETTLNAKCLNLVDLDESRPGLQHVLLKDLRCHTSIAH